MALARYIAVTLVSVGL